MPFILSDDRLAIGRENKLVAALDECAALFLAEACLKFAVER